MLVAALGWLCLVAITVDAMRHGSPSTTHAAVGPVTLVAVYLGSVLWVRHNRAIHRRHARRRSVLVVARPWTHDRLGRALVGVAETVGGRDVRVVVVGAVKSYV